MPKTAADAIVLEDRIVDDPMMSDAELAHQRRRHPGRVVGKIGATGNAMTRIGALCHVRNRQPHHERAAEWFKAAYEALYGSGMPAVDAGRVQVDHSISAGDGGMARRIDAAFYLREVMAELGKRKADIVISVVVLGVPVRELADHWRERRVMGGDLLASLDEVARLRGWLS